MGLIITDTIDFSYFPSFATYKCKQCHTQIFSQAWIIPGEFSGRTGDAFFINKAINCIIGKSPLNKNFRTGNFKISYVHCFSCKQYLGWKYLIAQRSCEKYKVGKLVIEKSKIAKSDNNIPDFEILFDKIIKKQDAEVEENIRKQPLFFQYVYKIFLNQFDDADNDNSDPIITQFYNFITILNLKIKNFETDDQLLNLLTDIKLDDKRFENSDIKRHLNNLPFDNIAEFDDNSRKKKLILTLLIKDYKPGMNYSIHPTYLKLKQFYDNIIILNSPKFLIFKDQSTYFEINKFHPVLSFQSFVSSIRKNKGIRERFSKNNDSVHRHAIYKDDYQFENYNTDDDESDDSDSFVQSDSLFWNFSNFNLPLGYSPMMNYVFLDTVTGKLKFNSWITDAENDGYSTKFISFKNKPETKKDKKKDCDDEDDDLFNENYSISYGSSTSNNTSFQSTSSGTSSSSSSSSASSTANTSNNLGIHQRQLANIMGMNAMSRMLATNELDLEDPQLRNIDLTMLTEAQRLQLERNYRQENEIIRLNRTLGRRRSRREGSNDSALDNNINQSNPNSASTPATVNHNNNNNNHYRYRNAISRRRHRRRTERLFQNNNSGSNLNSSPNISYFPELQSSPPRNDISLRNSTMNRPVSIPILTSLGPTVSQQSQQEDIDGEDEDEEMYEFEQNQHIPTTSEEIDDDHDQSWIFQNSNILRNRRTNWRSSGSSTWRLHDIGIPLRSPATSSPSNRVSGFSSFSAESYNASTNEERTDVANIDIEEDDEDEPSTNVNHVNSSNRFLIARTGTNTISIELGDLVFEEEDSNPSYTNYEI